MELLSVAKADRVKPLPSLGVVGSAGRIKHRLKRCRLPQPQLHQYQCGEKPKSHLRLGGERCVDRIADEEKKFGRWGAGASSSACCCYPAIFLHPPCQKCAGDVRAANLVERRVLPPRSTPFRPDLNAQRTAQRAFISESCLRVNDARRGANPALQGRQKIVSRSCRGAIRPAQPVGSNSLCLRFRKQ
jgi:hypothetical protein